MALDFLQECRFVHLCRLASVVALSTPSFAGSWVSETGSPGDFTQETEERNAAIVYSPTVAPVVGIAATNLAMDIERVTGRRPGVQINLLSVGGAKVVAGTVGISAPIEDLVRAGEFAVRIAVLPTHPIRSGGGLRFALGLDGQTPQVVDAAVKDGSADWAHAVLNASQTRIGRIKVNAPGRHALTIYMVDAGVLLDKVVIHLGRLEPSYLGPPEPLQHAQ